MFDNINIIENNKIHNLDFGYYKMINLWQNPDYNEKYINFYSIVNQYLLGKNINVNKNWLIALELQNEIDFFNFIVYYINKLTKIIHKNPSVKKQIFFRGEYRETFNYNVNDIVFYSTFQSLTTSLTTAFKFTETFNEKHQTLLFVLELNVGSYYKKLNTKLKYHNYKDKITQIIDENEFLLMANSYYQIVDKQYYGKLIIVKMKLCYQDFHQIVNGQLYKKLDIVKSKNITNFNCPDLNIFLKKNIVYQEIILKLVSLKKHNIGVNYYYVLIDPYLSNIFTLDIEAIMNLYNSINEYNFNEIKEEIKTLGIGYYDYQTIEEYKHTILTINMLIGSVYIPVDKLTVYSGFKNIDAQYKKDIFIQSIEKIKLNEIFQYDDILISYLSQTPYLYDDIYNDIPTQQVVKNNKYTKIYYKYLIQFNLSNVKICTCSEHNLYLQNQIILIPSNKMKIVNKSYSTNKFNLSIVYYEIDVFN
jgi:hypothetical protein